MSYELNETLSPLTRSERNKVNENWNRISVALNSLQSQINFFVGGDVADLISEINEALQEMRNMIDEGETTIDQLDAGMQAMSGYIDTLEEFVPRMESSVETAETLIPVLQGLQSSLTTLNNNVTNAEGVRVTSENTRVSNENTRISNENTRIANENERQETLGEMNLLVDNFKSFAYSSNVEYDFPNFVLYNGNTYMALRRVQGLTPTNDGVNWRLAAQRGVDGAGAVSKVNDISPDANGNVTIPINFTYDISKTLSDSISTYANGITLTPVSTSSANTLQVELTTALNSLLNWSVTNSAFRFVMTTTRRGNLSMTQAVDFYSNSSNASGTHVGTMIRVGSFTSPYDWGTWKVTFNNILGSGNPNGVFNGLKGWIYVDIDNNKMYFKTTGTSAVSNTGWALSSASLVEFSEAVTINGFTGQVKYKKAADGLVTVRVHLDGIPSNPSGLAFTNIPTEYRPVNPLPVQATVFNGNIYNSISSIATIRTNGDIVFTSSVAAPNSYKHSAEVSYYVDL